MAPAVLGIIHPFQRDGRSDFAAATGEQLIRSSIVQILGTVGSSDTTPGELPWRTEFGSLLYRLRHQKNDALLQELARVYVVDALKHWEPRIVVTAVTVQRRQHEGEDVLEIRIRYDISSTNALASGATLSSVERVEQVVIAPRPVR